MTPQEISEYKMRWMSSGTYFSVRIHSDLADEGKTWCRRQLGRHQWKMDTWTDVYEHTFFFEDSNVSQNFITEFSNWVNR